MNSRARLRNWASRSDGVPAGFGCPVNRFQIDARGLGNPLLRGLAVDDQHRQRERVQLVADEPLAVFRGMGEDAADDLRPSAERPDEYLARLSPDPGGIGPAIDRLALELELLRALDVAVNGKAGRIARVQLEQLPALALGGLLGAALSPACWPVAASSKSKTVTAFMRPPAIDWAINNLNSGPDRLRIKSYDYKYRRRAGVVNEILRKFVDRELWAREREVRHATAFGRAAAASGRQSQAARPLVGGDDEEDFRSGSSPS